MFRVPNIIRQLRDRGVITVGNLAALSEFDVCTFDFKHPKLATVRNALKQVHLNRDVPSMNTYYYFYLLSQRTEFLLVVIC